MIIAILISIHLLADFLFQTSAYSERKRQVLSTLFLHSFIYLIIFVAILAPIFEIKKIAVGLNYPPMHPRCRSTTIPIIDYESLIKQGREEIGEKDIESNEKEALTNNENKSITKEPIPNTFTMAWAQNDKVEYNEVRKLQK